MWNVNQTKSVIIHDFPQTLFPCLSVIFRDFPWHGQARIPGLGAPSPMCVAIVRAVSLNLGGAGGRSDFVIATPCNHTFCDPWCKNDCPKKSTTIS